MNDPATHPVINDISNKLDSLTPKAQTLGTYIMQNPAKAVFMTTKELAETCGISEATVVRFVSTLGYKGYSDFQEALKDFNYKWAKLKFHTQEDTLFVDMELDGKPSKILPFEYSKESGGFIRVDASSPGSHFQGIKLDVNLKLPFNEVIKSGNKLKSIFN